MGLTMAVVRDEDEFPVQGLDEKTLYILEEGEVSPIQPTDELFWKHEIRFSDNWIKIESLDVTPASSKVMEEMTKYQDTMGVLDNAQFHAELALSQEMGVIQTSGQALAAGMDPAAMEAMMEDTSNYNLGVMSDYQGIQDYADNKQGDVKDLSMQFDHLRVRMQVQPGQSVEDVFLVAIAKYYPPEAQTGSDYEYNVKLFECPPLVAGETNDFFFLFGGFPFGPKIGEISYHFYSGGDEIPSNYSYQRILLDKEQAFDFLYADYVSKEDTRDSEPRLFQKIKAPDDWSPVVKDGLAEASVAIRVLPDGSIQIVEMDVEDSILREKLETALVQCRFFPKIKADELVEAEVELRISDLMEI